MLKPFVCLFLAIAIAVAVWGCSAAPAEPTQNATTQPPTPTQSLEEQEMLKLMIIGNSHSLDAFHLLWQAFQDQMPEQQVLLGVMYYSGCSINQHIQFANNGDAVYRYHRISNGTWEIFQDVTLASGLQDQQWDVILYQAAKADLDTSLNLDGRRTLEKFVASIVPQPYTQMWHTSWPSPNEEAFFSPDWVRQPPEGYKENLMRLYGFNPITQFSVNADLATKHILTDPTYEKALSTGAGIMHAHYDLGVPQLELWRDYTHLSDYGRLVVAYTLYAQFTGNPVETVGIDTVPVALRHTQFQHLGDLTVTEEMKQVIKACANYSITDPYTIPAG